MTRKDYIEIAKIIKAAQQVESGIQLRYVVSELCGVLKRDNPNFDKYRFLDACGME